jgi:hypothetical protein
VLGSEQRLKRLALGLEGPIALEQLVVRQHGPNTHALTSAHGSGVPVVTASTVKSAAMTTW